MVINASPSGMIRPSPSEVHLHPPRFHSSSTYTLAGWLMVTSNDANVPPPPPKSYGFVLAGCSPAPLGLHQDKCATNARSPRSAAKWECSQRPHPGGRRSSTSSVGMTGTQNMAPLPPPPNTTLKLCKIIQHLLVGFGEGWGRAGIGSESCHQSVPRRRFSTAPESCVKSPRPPKRNYGHTCD